MKPKNMNGFISSSEEADEMSNDLSDNADEHK